MTIPSAPVPESVSWSLSGASSVSASVSGSTAEYDGILPDTNVLLEANGDGIKESLVLNSAAAPTTWVFPMTLTGLSLSTAADGTVELVDDAGTVVASLPKAYAFDASVDPVSGEHRENWSVSYEIITVAGAPAIRMTLDPAWLHDPALKFPVTVDPTLTLSTSGQTDTTYVEYPYDEDFSSASVLKVGTYDGGAHIGQSFIKVPGLPVNNGYHITAAKLALFDIWAATCGSSTSYQVFPVASSWSVTGSKSWSDRPPTAAAIGTWTGTASSTVCANSSLDSGTGQWQYVQMSTGYFQNIAMGQTPNNGLSVFASGTDSTSWKQFDSDHVSGYAPIVELTYAPDKAADISRMYPVTGFTSSTLTPQLQARVTDSDSWPAASPTVNFALYDAAGTQLASSGYTSSQHWDVPVGTLNWDTSYYWTVSAYDGWTTKTSSTQTFSTAVAQPLVASRLAQNSGHGYDEEAGNFTTSATDAKVATVGPPLQVDRAYNSLDVRTSGAFGAGWSSLADMRVQPDDDGSGGVVVTGADGRQQRFGRNSSELHQIAGVGDQTGDGVDDAVAVDQTTGKLWLYKGPDYSALTRGLIGSGGWNGMKWLTGGDITGDGIGDVIAARTSDGTLWLYPGKAGGGLNTAVKIGSGGWNGMANLALTAPLKGDGRKDLVAAETSSSKLYAYPVLGGGTLDTRLEIGDGGWNGMAELMGGDFNGDGRGDVAAVEISTGLLWLYPGTGSGALAARVQLGPGWNSMVDLAPVDGISGDATTDFLATQKSSGIRFLYHSGASFSAGHSYNTKTATGMAVYTAAAGEFGTFGPLPGSNAGWALLDTSGTTYTFGQASGTSWKPTKVSDRYGRSLTLAYDSSAELKQVQSSVSHRSLYFTWTTPPQASHPHVATVTTDAATGGDAATAALWTYGYTRDDLTSVCPPSATAPATASDDCYAYTYAAGSNYPAAALDAGPRSYWRLDDPAGSGTTASSVLANEQTDAGVGTKVTLGGQTGPLTGSSATAATFAGAGYVTVPAAPLHASTSRAVSLWFKTSGKGVLIGDQEVSTAGATVATHTYAPVLYVGSDGKLHGHWWSAASSGTADFGSVSTVNNNTWHHAVLSSDGSVQALYLDGTQQDTLAGAPDDQRNAITYIGAGFAQGWLNAPADVSYFTGSISDVAFYDHPLTATQVTDLRTSGTSSASFLTRAANPSGRVTAEVTYDTAADRLTSVTDENGGTYTLGRPVVTGSSAVFRSAVLGADPVGYWPLGDDPGSSDADDDVNGGDGAYDDTTLGVAGPFSAGDATAPTAATFNGVDSSVLLPQDLGSAAAATAEMWFKTTKPNGILLGSASEPLGSDTLGEPLLWIGSDGKLYGGWFTSAGTPQLATTSTVTNGAWHHVVLTGTATKQALYLDGTLVKSADFAGTLGVLDYQYLGAGRTGTGFHALPDRTDVYFSGQLAQAALYATALTSAQVTDQWKAYHASSGTIATETVQVTGPGTGIESSQYDLSHGGRILSSTDGDDGTTSYGYDTGGFVHTVTDPQGDVTTTGHDSRGNAVSRTTCQDKSAAKCSTSFFTYYLNTTSADDPRNDEMLTSSDGRSADAGDTTYRTTYTYDAGGNKLTEKTPAVAGHTDGLISHRTYTTSSTAGYLPGTTAPAGLLATTTTPGGAQTSYVYYANGDLAQVTSPSGLRTAYVYDQLGRALTTTVTGTGVDNVTSDTYDASGRVLTQTAPPVTDQVNGAVVHTQQTTYTYDPDGNTLTTTVSDTTGGDTARTATNTYNAHGQLDTATDPMGHVTRYTYDAYGNQATKTEPGGRHYTFTYDAEARLLTTTLDNYTGSAATPATPAAQLLEQRTYRPDGRLDTVTDAIGVTTTYDYYDNGLTKQITDIGASGTAYVDEQDTYDAAGNLTEQLSKNGTLTTRHTVDAANRLLTETADPSGTGRTTAYTYDADSHLLTEATTDAAGDPPQQWTYTYDTAGDKLTAAQRADATTTLTTTWTYDQRGLATTMTDPRQNTYTYTYDEAGRPAQTVAPAITVTSPVDGSTSTAAPTTLTGYDTFGEQTETEDARGNITVTAYDADGRKTATTLPSYTPAGATDPLPATTTWTWDSDGNLTAQTDAAGHTTDYAYDQLGDQVSQTNPAIPVAGTMTRGTWTSTYDLAGNQLTQQSPYGAVTHATYDDLGRSQSTWSYVYLSQDAATKVQSTTSYSPAGEIAATTSATGLTQSATYDALGRTLSTADTSGHTTRYTYDLNDNTLSTALPDGSGQRTAYDAAGRKTATADLDTDGTVLRTTSATYDADSNLLSTTNALHTTETYTYDALGDLLTQTEPVAAGHAITTGYGYDAAGEKTAYTNGNGNTTYYTYTPWGLPDAKVVPATSTYTSPADRTTTQAYDALGQVTSSTLPGGVTLTTTYDALGDVTGQSGTGADAPTAARTFSYSLDQNLVATTAGSAQETYDTNALGQLLGAAGQAGASSFTYNPDGAMLSRTDAAGTSTYTYDTDGRQATTADPATGATLAYHYNSLSQPTSVTLGSGRDTRTFGYDTLHRLKSDTLSGPTGTQVAAVSYGYDDADQLTTRTTSGFAGAGTSSYGYDQAGRLTSWTSTPTGGTATTTPYRYDDDGNRTTAGTSTFTYDARDQLTFDGTTSYGYTARGTMTGSTVTTTGFTTTSTFDAYGQQATVGSTAYAYDALGRTTTAAGTPLAYSGQDNTLAADSTSTYTHDSAGALTAVAGTATPATLAFTDVHTDLVGQYAPDGTTLTGSAAYDPWGAPIAASTLTGSVGYQSEHTDPTTGQVNMHARWYTPTTGTFTSTDTIDNPATGTSVNANPFTYGNDSPLIGTDPSGHGINWGDLGKFAVLENPWADAAEVFWNAWTAGSNSIKSSDCTGYGAAFCAMNSSAVTHNPIYTNPVYYNPDEGDSTHHGGGGRPTHHGGGGSPSHHHGGGGPSAAERAAAAARAAERAAAEARARAEAIRRHAVALTASIGKSTLTATSAAVAQAPAAAINIAGASTFLNNAAFAVAAGATTAAVCATIGCKLPKDSLNQNCSAGTSEGWQFPLPLDAQDRATGVLACVTGKSLRPSGTSPVTGSARATLSGYSKSQDYVDNVMGLDPAKVVNACHLLADTLGGSGTDQRNLATCFRGVNTNDRSAGSHGGNNMVTMEKRVKKAALAGQSVTYLVVPLYRNASSKVPYRFLLSARGYYSSGVPGLRSTMKIDNTYGPTGVNMGYVIK
ncbi:DUF6531 domain-containing protein [Streptomyces sp. NBC_00433]